MLSMVLSVFETMLNRALSFDARTKDRLRVLDGKTLHLHISDLNLDFYVLFTEEGIRLQREKNEQDDLAGSGSSGSLGSSGYSSGAAEVRVRAPSAALMSFVLSRDLKEASRQGVLIEGDLELALEIQHFMQDLDIDWEEMLSRYTGDWVAGPVFGFLKKFRKKQTKLVESFLLSSGAFLQEELQCLPTAVEVEHFNESLDNLRHQVDRCEARVKILAKNRSSQAD